jgi:hypothetical protein
MPVPCRLLFASLLIAGCSSGRSYYISTNGDDSGDGSTEAPFRTVARGVRKAAPGDTVLVRDGTYGNEGHISDGTGGWNGYRAPVTISTAGTSSAWITIKAQNKGKAILDCGTTSSALGCDKYIYLNSTAAYWSFQGLVFTRGAFGGIGTDLGASHIRVTGCRFESIGNWIDRTQIGEDGIGFDSSATDWWIEGNEFHDIGRTNASNLDHGIYAEGTDITIINNIFYNIPHGWGIQLANGATNWLIANNTFASPSHTQGGLIMLWRTNTNITIRNNILYYPGGSYGIDRYTSTLKGCSVDHNLVYGSAGVIHDSAACTFVGNEVGADPKFVNLSTQPYDFHLRPGSPAIGLGLNQGSVAMDFDGNSRPGKAAGFDLGAYQGGK